MHYINTVLVLYYSNTMLIIASLILGKYQKQSNIRELPNNRKLCTPYRVCV